MKKTVIFKASHFVAVVVVEGSEQLWYPVLLNRGELKRDRIVWGSIGGGAQLTKLGRKAMAALGAKFYKKPNKDGAVGAYFSVSEKHKAIVQEHLVTCDPQFMEESPHREAREELTTKELEFQEGPILRPRLYKRVKLTQVDIRILDYPIGGQECAEHESVLRVQHRWMMIVPPEVIASFARSKVMSLLTEEEVRQANKSHAGRITHCGKLLGNNVAVVSNLRSHLERISFGDRNLSLVS